jgi:hypothetical protein
MSKETKHTFYTLVAYVAIILAAWCISVGIAKVLNNMMQ